MIHRLLILLVLMYGVSSPVAAEQSIDLNGFRLWQYRAAAENLFGKPFKKFSHNASEVEAHTVTADSYMVFEYWNKFPQNIYSLQISGYPTKMTPFKGLVLGDSEAKVHSILGKPSSTKKIDYPSVTVCYYDNANLTTEIDQQGRLYSIKITAEKELLNDAETGNKHWDAFKKAVLAKNQASILQSMRPDVEIYKAGSTLSIGKRFADFQSAPDKAFMQALIGDANSVRSRLELTNPTPEMRVTTEMGVGYVYKFYKDPVLTEIVFFPYDGQYRVFEVAFRVNGETKQAPKK